MLIWLLSGVKQTKEATEAARVSSGPIEVKIGTADALRPTTRYTMPGSEAGAATAGPPEHRT